MLPAVSGENWTRRIFYNYVPFLCRNKVYYGMSSALIYNVRQLVNTREGSHVLRGGALACLPCIDNAWIHIEGDRIAAYGPMSALPASLVRLIGEGREST